MGETIRIKIIMGKDVYKRQEADELPGLTVDRYNDILVCQISSYGLDKIKDMIYEILLEVLTEDGQDVKGIYERNDIKVRVKEGLPLERCV